MLAAERRDEILSKLEKAGRVLVAELREEYDVSEETIRRDLEKLETEGLARRCYGGASFTGGRELPYHVRKKSNVSAKRQIAAAVARLIGDGESVMLDDSSTAIFVAQALLEKQGLTILTNSLEIALLLSGKQDWRVLLAGGAMKLPSLSLTGVKTEQFLADYHADWAVISCAGVHETRGVSDVQEDSARIKRAMLQAADRTVLAVDSRKFGRRAFATICSCGELDTVVTDLAADDPRMAAFAAMDIRFITTES